VPRLGLALIRLACASRVPARVLKCPSHSQPEKRVPQAV
jgi:hypothetical protein